jgi:DNA-binding IclR family transcriptional regulator
MQLVDFCSPPGQEDVRTHGALYPIFGSATGSALLADWPTTSVRMLIARSRDQLGALASDPDAILERLREVRRDGHAFGGLSYAAEAYAIAVALPGTALGNELIVNLRGPADKMNSRRWYLAATMHEAIACYLKRGGAEN